MKPFIPKQTKQVKDRLEVKVDTRLIARLDKYCEYLESDRDYVLSQALGLIFRKDKAFQVWLTEKDAKKVAEPPVASPANPAVKIQQADSNRRGTN